MGKLKIEDRRQQEEIVEDPKKKNHLWHYLLLNKCKALYGLNKHLEHAFFITKAIRDGGEFFGIHGKAMGKLRNMKNRSFELIPPRKNSVRLKFHLLRISYIRNSIRLSSTFSGYLTSEILSGDIPLSPDISHLAPNARWERRTFQLPRSDMSGSSDSAYPENFLSVYSAAVFS
ncbi:hypothetical protein CK203_017978 [Vitis vinifera]|uniref:Uncharacterized protein n=1 Tax=Vitis vinifera TaxID=29760 RepID=A0A438JVY4_VITVI|nr:hypothetical protein CK203_017978 [Vitis vinifera]